MEVEDVASGNEIPPHKPQPCSTSTHQSPIKSNGLNGLENLRLALLAYDQSHQQDVEAVASESPITQADTNTKASTSQGGIVFPEAPVPTKSIDDNDESLWQDFSDTETYPKPKVTKARYEYSKRENDTHSIASSSSDSSDSVSMLKQAIALNPEDLKGYDGKSAPMNGSQYLLSVMMERKRVAKVSVGKNIRKKVEKLKKKSVPIEVVKGESEEELQAQQFQEIKDWVHRSVIIQNTEPVSDWERIILDDFKKLRERLNPIQEDIVFGRREFVAPVQLPSHGNSLHWLQVVFGHMLSCGIESGNFDGRTEINLELFFTPLRSEPLSHVNAVPGESGVGDTDTEQGSSNSRKLDPIIPILLSIPQRTIIYLINLHLSWLKNYNWIHNDQGKWLYGLLVCLLEPIESPTLGDLREIFRICKNVKENRAFVGSEDKKDDFLKVLDLFLVIIGYGFKQWDLL